MSLLNRRVNYGCQNCLHTCTEGASLLGAVIPPASNWANTNIKVMSESDGICRRSCVYSYHAVHVLDSWTAMHADTEAHAQVQWSQLPSVKILALILNLSVWCLNNIEFIQFLASLLEARSLARAIFSLIFFGWTIKRVCALQWNIYTIFSSGSEIYVTVTGHSNTH